MLLTSCLDIEEFFSVKLLVSSYLRVLVVDLHLICDDTLRSRFSTIRDQPQRAIRQCVKVSIISRSCDVRHVVCLRYTIKVCSFTDLCAVSAFSEGREENVNLINFEGN